MKRLIDWIHKYEVRFFLGAALVVALLTWWGL
jgi:hypothetical protein